MIFFRPSSKGGPAKTLHTNAETLPPSFRVNWVWSERVNLYNSQIMIRKIMKRQKHMHSWAPGPLPDRRAPVISTGSPPPVVFSGGEYRKLRSIRFGALH